MSAFGFATLVASAMAALFGSGKLGIVALYLAVVVAGGLSLGCFGAAWIFRHLIKKRTIRLLSSTNAPDDQGCTRLVARGPSRASEGISICKCLFTSPDRAVCRNFPVPPAISLDLRPWGVFGLSPP